MPSLCRSLKTEYETLKTLTHEFVSACEKAGDPRNLSVQQLRDLQVLKRELEQRRNDIEEKLETKAVRMWRKVYESALSAVSTEDGPYKGWSVKDLMREPTFHDKLLSELLDKSARGQFTGGCARYAVKGMYGAIELGILTDQDQNKIHAIVDKVEFQNTLSLEISKNALGDWQEIQRALTSMYAARELGLISNDGGEGLQEFEKKKAEWSSVMIAHNIISGIRSRGTLAESDFWDAVMSFHAALGLHLLDQRQKGEVEKELEQNNVLTRITKRISGYAVKGQSDFLSAWMATVGLHAIKELIQLSSRQRKR